MTHPNPHAWIAKATDVQLELVHRDHCRWLGLPNADLWAEEYADRSAEITAIWAEIKARRSTSQPLERAMA